MYQVSSKVKRCLVLAPILTADMTVVRARNCSYRRAQSCRRHPNKPSPAQYKDILQSIFFLQALRFHTPIPHSPNPRRLRICRNICHQRSISRSHRCLIALHKQVVIGEASICLDVPSSSALSQVQVMTTKESPTFALLRRRRDLYSRKPTNGINFLSIALKSQIINAT